MDFEMPTKEEQDEILMDKIENHIYPLIEEFTDFTPPLGSLNPKYYEKRRKFRKELTQTISKEVLKQLYNNDPKEYGYKPKELTPEERYPKDFPKPSSIKQAEQMLEETPRNDFDVENWDHYKESAIRKYRDRWLKEIIEEKLTTDEEIKPIHRKALNDEITAEDINVQDRYNAYVDYLKFMIHRLINDLMFNIYKTDSKSTCTRIDGIRKLFELYKDQRTIKEGTEDKAWRTVNEAWGIDCGLE